MKDGLQVTHSHPPRASFPEATIIKSFSLRFLNISIHTTGVSFPDVCVSSLLLCQMGSSVPNIAQLFSIQCLPNVFVTCPGGHMHPCEFCSDEKCPTEEPREISLLCHHRWWGEAHLVCVFAFVSVSVGYIPSSGTARSQGKCVHSLDQWWRIAFQKMCSLCIPNASVYGICFSAPLTAGFIKHFHTLQSDGWENGTVSLWCAFL